ncbi:MAG: hypothetical protein FWF91_06365 [Coriobacteriia bacterium]|nr:hypothetical protein [Coriobacteriia bacterium]
MKTQKTKLSVLVVSILLLAMLLPVAAFAAQGDNDFNGNKAPVITAENKITGTVPAYDKYVATPSSTNLQNSTTITITIKGYDNNGVGGQTVALASVKLKQNGTQTVIIGDYTISVAVNQNNKITGCTVIGAPIVVPDPPDRPIV